MNQEKLEKAKNFLFIALFSDILITAISGVDSYLTAGIIREINSGVQSFTQEFGV